MLLIFLFNVLKSAYGICMYNATRLDTIYFKSFNIFAKKIPICSTIYLLIFVNYNLFYIYLI